MYPPWERVTTTSSGAIRSSMDRSWVWTTISLRRSSPYWVLMAASSGGDPEAHKDGHWDVAHSDIAHGDSHTDTAHSDAAHQDAHTDVLHADGNYGTGVIIAADGDTGSIRAVARKTGDPSAADVRAQPVVDGKNVVITLIDAATGGPLLLNPGDTAYIAGLAYSRTAGAGVEGPLWLGRGNRFTVAPVCTDLG